MQKENFNKIHRAKKSLGQNFLKSEMALKKIIETGEIKPNDVILEIGPGRGALTGKLLATGCQLMAVEKDYNLYEFLKIKFEKEILSGQLKLLNEDILEFDVNQTILKFFSGPRFSPSLSQPDHSKNLKSFDFKIIANIPYNITGAILKKFLTEKHQPECMVLMVQHEVAKRIMAHDRKESILSISVKAYGEPKMIMKVPARYFSPAPKVDSAIIAIRNISRKNFVLNSPLEEYPDLGRGEVDEFGNASTPSRRRATPQEENNFEQKFWEIVKTGFAHKRKKLAGNLKGILSVSQERFLRNLELGNKRAEDLSLADWIALAKQYNPSLTLPLSGEENS